MDYDRPDTDYQFYCDRCGDTGARCILVYDAKKREASAKAGKAEADNITQYAAQWQKLYDEKVKHEEELNEKIDALYVQLNEQRDELARLKRRWQN